MIAARPALLAAALLALSAPAQAFDTLAVGQTLFGLGALGGLVAGLVAAWRLPRPTGFGPAFGTYLGALCVLVSTWAGTLDTVPLTLAFGAAAGIGPFALLFLGLRRWGRRRR